MPLLEISHLKKSFIAPDDSEHLVVNVASFALAEQAQVALEGESGSGKTTFLHLIAGILKPDAGRIVLAGQEMSALSEPARDRLRTTTIGYIFQTRQGRKAHHGGTLHVGDVRERGSLVGIYRLDAEKLILPSR